MEEVRVNLKKKIDDSYDIVIGRGLFDEIAEGLSKLDLSYVAIITDSNVKKHYGDKLLSLLKDNGLDAMMISFPPGEKSKNRKTKEKIEDALLSKGLDRHGLIIALGGGVVGDIAGFIASTFMRGVPYIQIPTSLLAMLDSSVGGKTGVDTQFGKNMVGTFYQPKRVFIDLDVLKTLPKPEILNGIAEMIKHSVISSSKFFIFIDDYLDKILALDTETLEQAIKMSCEIKKEVVEKDEKEESFRRVLNFGHTIAHAIEKASDFTIKHGRAVALGMIAETKIAAELEMLSPVECEKIVELITRAGFDTKLGKLNVRHIIDSTHHDKKNISGRTNYVLPETRGQMDLDVSVAEDVVEKVLGEMK
jgi:3-dehydroquinate synthase